MKIKWIVGYIDSYGSVYHKVVNIGDNVDSHTSI